MERTWYFSKLLSDLLEDNNFLYLTFLKLILTEVQAINLPYQKRKTNSKINGVVLEVLSLPDICPHINETIETIDSVHFWACVYLPYTK